MAPARVNDDPMSTESRKRSPDVQEDDGPGAKRKRVTPSTVILRTEYTDRLPHSPTLATPEELARRGLRRSIALTLQKVGFESASPDAMESFVSLTETCKAGFEDSQISWRLTLLSTDLSSLVDDIRKVANAARRTHPIPKDFEYCLKRFNLTTSSLKPHKKPPVPRSKRLPTWEPLEMDNSIEINLPVLSEELNGAQEKEAKEYIPVSFPSFPSTHTYKSTPESIDGVAILKELPPRGPDSASQGVGGSQKQSNVEWPLAPQEIPYGDPKKMREAAAKEAKAGEEALRKLMRASKVASQKESWVSAQREPARRERYELWESAMRDLIEEEAKSSGKEIAPAEMHGEKGREGIADHSMIVNADKRHERREVVRAGGRKAVISAEVISSKG